MVLHIKHFFALLILIFLMSVYSCKNNHQFNQSSILIPTYDSLRIDSKVDSVLNEFIKATNKKNCTLSLYIQQLNARSNIYTLMAGDGMWNHFKCWTPMYYIKKQDKIFFVYCGMESLFNFNLDLKRVPYSSKQDTFFAWTIVSTLDTFYVDREEGYPYAKIPHINPHIDSILRKNLRDFNNK